MKCVEISVQTDREAAEAVSALFNEHSQSGAVVEELWGDTPESITMRVKTFLPSQHTATLQRIEEALWHLGQIYPIPAPSIRWLSEADWLEKWKSGYGIQHFGRHIVIKPSWQAHAAAPEDVIIELDPGLAFGTGLHPSTRLCLEALEDWMVLGHQVLDVGTGSGILAIAAAKLGAASVVALDIDPLAIQVAEENATRNGVRETITLVQDSLLPTEHLDSADSQAFPATANTTQALHACGGWNSRFDLLMMNILAKVIAQSSRAIGDCLATNGRFIVSGIIQAQEDMVLQAFASAGLYVAERRTQKDWVALIGGKENEQSKDD
jgi:ribosomal protein L11 methyltransferase